MVQVHHCPNLVCTQQNAGKIQSFAFSLPSCVSASAETEISLKVKRDLFSIT